MVELFKAADKYEVLGLLQECTAAFRLLTGPAEVAPLLQVPCTPLRCCPRGPPRLMPGAHASGRAHPSAPH